MPRHPVSPTMCIDRSEGQAITPGLLVYPTEERLRTRMVYPQQHHTVPFVDLLALPWPCSWPECDLLVAPLLGIVLRYDKTVEVYCLIDWRKWIRRNYRLVQDYHQNKRLSLLERLRWSESA